MAARIQKGMSIGQDFRSSRFRPSGFDVEVYVLDDIFVSGCMKRLEAGVDVVPYPVVGEQFRNLSAGKVLRVLVCLHAVDEIITLPAHLIMSPPAA